MALYVKEVLGLDIPAELAPETQSLVTEDRRRSADPVASRPEAANAWIEWWDSILQHPEDVDISPSDANLAKLSASHTTAALDVLLARRRRWREAPRPSWLRLGVHVADEVHRNDSEAGLNAEFHILLVDSPWTIRSRTGLVWCSAATYAQSEVMLPLLRWSFARHA